MEEKKNILKSPKFLIGIIVVLLLIIVGLVIWNINLSSQTTSDFPQGNMPTDFNGSRMRGGSGENMPENKGMNPPGKQNTEPEESTTEE